MPTQTRPAPGRALSRVPTADELARFFGPKANPAWLDAFVRITEQLYRHYEYDRRRWRHFTGQIGGETNGMALVGMREDMRFKTPGRIVEVYRFRLQLAITKVTKGEELEPAIARGSTVSALARACVGEPVLLANIVYGGREGTPWMQGSRYIGRGPTQITHADNYAAIRDEIRRQPGGAGCPDLLLQPEALEQPEWGIRAAFADWAIKKLNRYADQDSLDLVSDALNTGNVNDNVKPHGMDNRRRWFAKATGTWPNEDLVEIADAGVATLKQGDEGPSVRRLQELLVAKNYFDRVDGVYGQRTEDAVVIFQRHHGLEPDGKAGPLTFSTLEVAPAREERVVSAETLVETGHETVGFTQWGKKLLRRVGKATGLYTADKATGLNIIDTTVSTAISGAETAIGKVEKVGPLISRAGKLFGSVSPTLTVSLVAIAATLVGLYILIDRLEKRAVKRAQQGANLKG